MLGFGPCNLLNGKEHVVALLLLRKIMGLAFSTDNRLEGRNENPAVKCKPSTEHLGELWHLKINEAAEASKIIAH